MRWKIVTACVVGLLLWGYYEQTLPVYTAEQITLRVDPRVGLRPLTIRIQIRIEPHAENRVLCFTWGLVAEDGMVSSSCRDVDGKQAQRSFQWYRELRLTGEWVITAAIQRSDGSVFRTSQTVNVFGGF